MREDNAPAAQPLVFSPPRVLTNSLAAAPSIAITISHVIEELSRAFGMELAAVRHVVKLAQTAGLIRKGRGGRGGVNAAAISYAEAVDLVLALGWANGVRASKAPEVARRFSALMYDPDGTLIARAHEAQAAMIRVPRDETRDADLIGRTLGQSVTALIVWSSVGVHNPRNVLLNIELNDRNGRVEAALVCGPADRNGEVERAAFRLGQSEAGARNGRVSTHRAVSIDGEVFYALAKLFGRAYGRPPWSAAPTPAAA